MKSCARASCAAASIAAGVGSGRRLDGGDERRGAIGLAGAHVRLDRLDAGVLEPLRRQEVGRVQPPGGLEIPAERLQDRPARIERVGGLRMVSGLRVGLGDAVVHGHGALEAVRGPRGRVAAPEALGDVEDLR